jgi:hypothetical protein
MEKTTDNRVLRKRHPLEKKYGFEPKKTDQEIEDEWKWH